MNPVQNRNPGKLPIQLQIYFAYCMHTHTYIVIFQDSQLELEMPKSIPSHTCTLYTCSQSRLVAKKEETTVFLNVRFRIFLPHLHTIKESRGDLKIAHVSSLN